MISRSVGWLALALVALVVVLLTIAPRFRGAIRSTFQPARQQAGAVGQAREDAYRANNVGAALLEQFNYNGAADAFRQALKIDPALTLARINLAIALLYVPDLDGAQREATEAARALPRDPHAQYILGLIARERGQAAMARAAFDRVLELDPRDVGSHVNLGQILLQQQRFDDAVVHLRTALDEEPYNVTAAYNLGLALTRSGQRDEGQKAMELSQTLRNGGYGVVYSPAYLQQGRYAEALASTGAERDLVDPATPEVSYARLAIDRPSLEAPADSTPSPFERRFTRDDLADDARVLVGSLGGGVALLDADGDGDLDLFVASQGRARLLRNDNGTFVEVTRDAGIDSRRLAGALGAVAGDYDNDGRVDLLVIRYGGNVLLHNDGGRFSDVTSRSRLPAYPFLSTSAAFVDFDHDGDLDIVVAGLADLHGARERATRNSLLFPGEFPGAPLQFVRNNGDGTFTEITAQTKVAGQFHAVSVVATDYDNHRDVDLLVARYDGPPLLLENRRDGTFRDVAAEAGLQVSGRVTSVAAADFNKDDFTDFFFGRADGPGVFAASNGHRRFTLVPAPAASAGAVAAQFVDYDNDGLLDLLTWSAGVKRLFRHTGPSWIDVTGSAFPGASPARPASARDVVAADLDGDADTDLIESDGGRVALWRNDGGNRHKTLRVQLAGRASNHLGVGAKVEMRAGSLRQRIETSAATPAAAPADILFGLGTRPGADVVRVLWPSGILQAETPPRADAQGGERTTLPPRMTLEELDRKPSSCPFLYTWNGSRFEFVTDFMGGGEMGYWEAPGVRNRPDADEYVRIRGDQLQPKDGRYELRVTNELEEAVFVDRLQLLAIAHPDDVEVFPNEGMIDPPRPFRLFAARHAHAPTRVIDDHGHDVTSRIARADRQYPDDFPLARVRGYAEEHALRVVLDRTPPDLLLLTGWTDYAFSSDNVAANQAGMTLHPPAIEARAGTGRWHSIVKDIGIPVGRPQTLVVDLRGRLPRGTTAIRLRTNMRIYWDQIQVADAAPAESLQIARLDPGTAALRARGFSAELTAAPPQPITYDYSRVTRLSPWKAMVGAYTREGDVLPLVTRIDDRFVVAAPGDEIAVSFDATRLAPLPTGSARTFLLFADGFSKEMDPNSASPEQIDPLPFHAMSGYPYPPSEHYPDTPDHRRYRDEYNTRRIVSPFASLDCLLLLNHSSAHPAPAELSSTGFASEKR